jgi:hypothetical protein
VRGGGMIFDSLIWRYFMTTIPDCSPALLYRLPDAAKLLSLSPRKVRALVDKGILPSFKIDHCRVIRHADLLLFVHQLGA